MLIEPAPDVQAFFQSYIAPRSSALTFWGSLATSPIPAISRATPTRLS